MCIFQKLIFEKKKSFQNIIMKTTYSAIEPVEQNETTTIQESTSLYSPRGLSKKSAIFLAVLAGVVCLLTFTSFVHKATGANKANIRASPAMGVSGVPDCPSEECFSSGCPKSAPFKCHDNNGCSSIPWTAPRSCRDQCTLEHCTYEIPSSAETCEGVTCSAQSCKGYQKCGASAPYQCLKGASTNGCNGDPFGWTVRSGDNVCSECCDTRTCA